ncbi:hypothetical protein AB0M25_30260 [Streptomyces griseomycini]|uniref:Uncharacterized protein n=1 Tax=Streptomyces griseomycini TaxID=66895 RepID=A0A7W7V8M0_9ACTN|nr:hypothetical protein [Streptomyces griseomycini]GGR23074.1 hypothetical protein GCM10015536_30860 [Streptomyces griseomycini]
MAATIDTGGTTAAEAEDRSAEERLERAQCGRTAPCAGTASALLRRVLLPEPLAQQPFTGGTVEFQAVPGQPVDRSSKPEA